MKRAIVFLLILVLPVFAYGFNPKTASIEEKMVFLNTDESPSRIDPVKVNRFRFLLDKLQERHPESRKNIADLTSRVQDVMKDSGISESLLDIMESMNQVKLDRRLGKIKYEDLITAYATLRIDGMSRTDAAIGLRQFFNGIARTKK